MNIEQAIDILKNSIADYVIGEYCEKCADNKICDDRNEDCYYQQALDTILNLIKKQSKEIEELKMQLEVEKIDNKYNQEETYEETIPRYRIRAKIEELNKDFKEYENGQEWEIQDEIRGQIDVLQSLLEKE